MALSRVLCAHHFQSEEAVVHAGTLDWEKEAHLVSRTYVC